MSEKNYVASSIKKITTKYGDLFNASFKVDDLQKISKKGWVNITIAQRKEVSEKGATHYAYENAYEPKTTTPNTVTSNASTDEDDLPF
jgi:hypothetical protein